MVEPEEDGNNFFQRIKKKLLAGTNGNYTPKYEKSETEKKMFCFQVYFAHWSLVSPMLECVRFI